MKNNVSLINFIDMTLDEKEMVLLWRNHPSIKQWMYNDKDIALENHLAFIESLRNSTDKLYFVVKQENEFIGVIDFTEIHKPEVYFGLYANPNAKIAGVGRILENICIDYAFNILKVDTLKLEVFAENEKAINLYKKFNFKEITKKIVNNREVICMELKNEDR